MSEILFKRTPQGDNTLLPYVIESKNEFGQCLEKACFEYIDNSTLCLDRRYTVTQSSIQGLAIGEEQMCLSFWSNGKETNGFNRTASMKDKRDVRKIPEISICLKSMKHLFQIRYICFRFE